MLMTRSKQKYIPASVFKQKMNGAQICTSAGKYSTCLFLLSQVPTTLSHVVEKYVQSTAWSAESGRESADDAEKGEEVEVAAAAAAAAADDEEAEAVEEGKDGPPTLPTPRALDVNALAADGDGFAAGCWLRARMRLW
jgi:hypothetical protein